MSLFYLKTQECSSGSFAHGMFASDVGSCVWSLSFIVDILLGSDSMLSVMGVSGPVSVFSSEGNNHIFFSGVKCEASRVVFVVFSCHDFWLFPR